MISLSNFIAAFNCSIKNNSSFFKVKKTRFVLEVIKILIQKKYLLGIKIKKDVVIVFLSIDLKRNNVLATSINSVSTSNRQYYIKANYLNRYKNELIILSTVQGILSNSEAKKRNIGGKVLFKVY